MPNPGKMIERYSITKTLFSFFSRAPVPTHQITVLTLFIRYLGRNSSTKKNALRNTQTEIGKKAICNWLWSGETCSTFRTRHFPHFDLKIASGPSIHPGPAMSGLIIRPIPDDNPFVIKDRATFWVGPKKKWGLTVCKSRVCFIYWRTMQFFVPNSEFCRHGKAPGGEIVGCK